MKKFFGFALSSSMFDGNCVIKREMLKIEEVKEVEKELISCLNPSHKATIDAMKEKYGINVPIPEVAPKVSLMIGDSLIVMGVRGLPRLTDRHEYTSDEISAATFEFVKYTLVAD